MQRRGIPYAEHNVLADEAALRRLAAKTQVVAPGSDDFALVCEPKMDGLAVALVYDNGAFVQGATQQQGPNSICS